MNQASISVDLFNPGQVLACLGFAEVTLQLTGSALANFDWSDGPPKFHLATNEDQNPFQIVLDFLSRAQVASMAPPGAGLSTAKWGVPSQPQPLPDGFPVSLPSTPATLPAVLSDPDSGNRLVIAHWADDHKQTGRDNAKFWAGSGGYPGAALVRDALNMLRHRLADAFADPFSLSAPQSSSFRLDWRRDYVPLDAGFSPNAHSNVSMLGFPLVELLAAIGLTNARPKREDKLTYRYSVPSSPQGLLHPMFLRTAIGAVQLPFPQRFFRIRLDWPGQVNQARCITDVIEEISQ